MLTFKDANYFNIVSTVAFEPKVAFITFAGERLGLGTGHLLELLLIANRWQEQDKVRIKFFLNNFSYGISLVNKMAFSYDIYSQECAYSRGIFKKIPYLLNKWGYNLALISAPILFKEELDWLSKKISPLIVILDNDEDQFFQVSAIINYNINQDQKFYKDKKGVACYIGRDYVPLCKTKLEKAKTAHNVKFRGDGIVVTLGGTNPNQLALKVISALYELNEQYHVSLVLGGGTPQVMHQEIEAWLGEHTMPCNLYYGLMQDDFYELLAKSSFAISAPGNTLYELCYLGIPTAAIAEDKLTLRVAEKFFQKKWCYNLGLGPFLPVNVLRERLCKFFVYAGELNNRVKNNFPDGLGVDRIIRIAEEVLHSKI